MKKEKKSNVALNILKFIGKVFLVLLLVLVIWICFSIFNKKPIESVIPREYAAYIQTDSAIKAFDPILDLEAIDIFLSSKDFSSLRGTFIDFRKSSLRKNPLARLCLNRKICAGYYPDTKEYVAVINMGFLSSFTRLSKFILPSLSIKDLNFIKNKDFYFFSYGQGDSKLYLKPCKNLVVITSSVEKLYSSFSKNYREDYTKEDLETIKSKTGSKIKIVVDAEKLIKMLEGSNDLVKKFVPLTQSNRLSMINFNLTDSQINISGEIPFKPVNGDSVTLKEASMPALVSKLPNIVQYYTIFNIGTVENIRDTLIPVISEKNSNPWEKAEPLCKTFFNLSLEEMLCSWTGKEYALLGIEGLNEPVFALQINDEKKRQEIFEKVINSIIIKDDTSLILNGVRLPKLMLPDFLQGLLGVFNINLPSPYYMVIDNYIYFCMSPEPLSAIFTSSNENKKISKNPNWLAASDKQKMDTSLSLFYDLERSVPFFLQNNSQMSQVLQLYSVGLCNLRLKDNAVSFSLQACSRKAGDLRAVPGFPIKLEGKSDYKLYSGTGKKADRIFWLENSKNIKAMNVSSMEIQKFELDSESWIIEEKNPKSENALWALTKDGTVYIFNKNLDDTEKKIFITGKTPASGPASYEDGIVFTTTENELCFVDSKGLITEVEIPSSAAIKNTPSVCGKTVALYEKSFKGKIYVYEDKVLINNNKPLEISGIAYGSPAIIKKNDSTYISFVTQKGTLYLWENLKPVTSFENELESIFYTNVVSNGNYFFALSDNGRIFRLSTEGRILSVIIPNAKTRLGYLYADSPQKNDICNIYIGLDGNLIYGFSEKLELLSGYPLAGCGKPAFADINGDHNSDTFVLTLDNTLNAWNLR